MSRPTLSHIAQQLGISKMTVSRALRGEKHVHEDLRLRIRAAAAELGYQPDPEIAKLMNHMRQMRRNVSPQTLALIWAERDPAEVAQSPWSQQLVVGARERAERLGFKLDEFYLQSKGMTARRLSQILEARGILGFVLSPLLSRSRGHVSMQWERFSSVAIGIGYARPALHRVHHHHYLGMMTAMRRLKKLGYRRIGFFASSTVDERMFGAWSASFLRHHPLPTRQATSLLCLPKTPSAKELQSWIRAAKPDVVLDGGDSFDWLPGQGSVEDLAYATLNWTADHPERSGINQQAEVLGAAAMDLLVAQFQHNERGIPKHPKIVMTEGEWREGTTAPRVR